MREDQLKLAAKITVILSVLALAVCLWRAATKPVTIVGTAQAMEETPARTVQAEETHDVGMLSLVPLDAAAEEDILIPLPAGIHSEDVQTKNLYLSRQFWVTLKTSRSGYGADLEVPVHTDKVREGVSVRTDRNTLSLRFGLEGLYEPSIDLVDGNLRVQLKAPDEAYRHVILVDPVPPASDDGKVRDPEQDPDAETGGDLTLSVAEEFARLYEDSDTKVYLTRQGSSWEEEVALSMLGDTGADLFVRLSADSNADVENFPAYDGDDKLHLFYNEKWYLRRYTNAEFARDLAAGVAGASGIAIGGIDPVGHADPLLAVCSCASARLTLPSTLPQEEDAGQLPARIAEGLRRAVDTACRTADGH